MRIGIDVDLVTLASDEAWWDWLYSMCRENSNDKTSLEDLKSVCQSLGREVDYDLSKYFSPPLNENVSPYDFWRSTNVYDTISPVKGAVDKIKQLIGSGHEVVFITHVKGHSMKSKYNNLVRLFGGGAFSFVVTKEKHLVNVDVIIDDRNEMVNKCFEGGIEAIRFDTPYTQDEKLLKGIRTISGWKNLEL